jgi:hypothetical protein
MFMKNLSIKEMEVIHGGDCFGEAAEMFDAWDNYMDNWNSTSAKLSYYAATGSLINCVAQI